MLRKRGYVIQLWDESVLQHRGKAILVHETEVSLFGLVRPVARHMLLNATPNHSIYVVSGTWRETTLGVWSYETLTKV
jgi:hypothetical protein